MPIGPFLFVSISPWYFPLFAQTVTKGNVTPWFPAQLLGVNVGLAQSLLALEYRTRTLRAMARGPPVIDPRFRQLPPPIALRNRSGIPQARPFRCRSGYSAGGSMCPQRKATLTASSNSTHRLRPHVRPYATKKTDGGFEDET